MIGFAIVGCGMIARVHARALAEIPGVRVAALVSRNLANAQALAREVNLDVPLETDLGRALARADVQAVIVTTPSGAHLEPAIAAAAAGKHVVVEKPLEVTLERCDRIIAACDRAGVKLGTIFPSRFGEAQRALKAALDDNRLGRLALAETTCKWWRPQSYYDEGDWKGTRALDGGGAFMNQGIHNVDLLAWLMGPVEHVCGYTAIRGHRSIEVEDTGVACLRFASGALGVIQATTAAYPGLPRTISVHGDRGSVVIEQDEVVRWQVEPETAEDRCIKQSFAARPGAAGGASDPKAIGQTGHLRQLADFAEAIVENRTPEVDGREGRKAVEIILAIYRSAESGRPVQLDEDGIH